MRGRLRVVGGCAAAIATVVAGHALAASASQEHKYVIAIGNNGVPAGRDRGLQPLRFADDDAIAFFSFASWNVRRAYLLTVVDRETSRRLGGALPEARPPSVKELDRVVAEIGAAIREDARNGVSSTVYLYYSGHGTGGEGREPELALMDEGLNRSRLYDAVLAGLPAEHVHVFVDACHAEAVVRPRDTEAQIVLTSEIDRSHFVSAATLARFPNVGVVLAATRSAQAHEWEAYQGGVFTHELLSGLRGAADVNGDGRIEYSEIAAFLSAANREVRNPHAHLDTVTRAPIADPHAIIVDVRQRAEDAMLNIPPPRSGTVFIEDDRGERLADVHPERGHAIMLALPADRAWYVHVDGVEAEVRPTRGARISWASLAFSGSRLRSRGALDLALHDGLFAVPFGPSYYRGFVDAATDFSPVSATVNGSHEALARDAAPPRRPDAARTWGWVSAATGGALALGAGMFGCMALDAKLDFDRTSIENRATEAADRYAHNMTAAAILGGTAVLMVGTAAYLLLRASPDATAQRVPWPITF